MADKKNSKNDNLDSQKKQKSLRHKKAAALKYDPKTDTAPVVTAKATGIAAKKLLQKAREENIPIENNEDLVEVLARINIGDQIPEELYIVVAEILSFIYELEDLS
ncbi:MAG: EscU/YscU/HrcU family type III secretion system export apparatus switch protein [Halanaerobium sp.]